MCHSLECQPGWSWNSDTCACDPCPDPGCAEGHVWDVATCSCLASGSGPGSGTCQEFECSAGMYFDYSLCGCYSSDPCPGVICDWNTVLNYGSCTCEPSSSGGWSNDPGFGDGGSEFVNMNGRRLASDSISILYIKNAANMELVHPDKQVDRFKSVAL